MNVGGGGYAAKSGAHESTGNRSNATTGDDFPMICETCLGSNPYLRMVKLPFGQKLCKISNQPYQGFRWKAGPQGRYKETIISYTVAQDKNICQTCLNDMVYGVPVGVRDKLLAKQDGTQHNSLTTSDVGTAFYYQSQAVQMENGIASNSLVPLGIHNLPQARQLNQFANTLYNNPEHHKTAFRNLPKLCSFWLIGTCSRVMKKACPFRPCCGEFVFPEIAGSHKSLHAKLVEDLKAQGPAAVMQNLDSETREAIKSAGKGVNREEAIRKRVNGDDDLTKKYIGKMKNMNLELPTPEDQSITTLWLGNVEQDMTEMDLKDAFYAYGQITGIHIVRSSKCAFVEYASREMAEFAAAQLYNSLTLKGRPVTINWAKPKTQNSNASSNSNAKVVMPAPPGMENQNVTAYALPGVSLPVLETPSNTNEDEGIDTTSKKRKVTDTFNQPPPKMVYESMLSTRLGSKN